VRRRRQCAGCGRRFTTYERREREPLFVNKRSGKRQPFDRTKLRAALLHAAHKRPVSSVDVERLVERIEAAVNDGGGELAAERIGELSLEGLRQLDTGAYLQFAGTLAEPAFAISGDSARGGSVRVSRKDPRSTRDAASRRT
jgi:transcriptional repressor NrdR